MSFLAVNVIQYQQKESDYHKVKMNKITTGPVGQRYSLNLVPPTPEIELI